MDELEYYDGQYSGPQIDELLGKVDAGVVPVNGKGINFLDNWYFVGGGSQQGGEQFPINQRGQTAYSNVAYTIDRWRTWESGDVLQVVSGGIKIAATVLQNIEAVVTSALVNQPVTLSILFADGKLFSNSFASAGTSQIWDSVYVGYGGVNFVTFLVGYVDPACFRIEPTTPGTWSDPIAAVKLELGDTQTLARQVGGAWVLNEIPNYQQELAKCQRYFLPDCAKLCTAYSYGNGLVQLKIPTSVRMFDQLNAIVSSTDYLVRISDNHLFDLSTSAFTVAAVGSNWVVINISDQNFSSQFVAITANPIINLESVI